MTILLSFILGFFIAAVGIVAPGMLNMTIAKLSVSEDRKQALLFAFGAVLIVLVQSFVGVYFAKVLGANPNISENLKKFGTVIFILLTAFFIYNGFRAKKPKLDVAIKSKNNRFIYGITLSSLNMFAIPYYAFVSLTLASKDIFQFTLPNILIFSFAAALGTFFIFYLYAVLFKKVEHKVTFITNNINFLIAAITGLVAVSSLYKMLTA
ncbi:LysE family transporter [Flavobacterium tibetense]|uniref:Lysine transporter LysE n=1 Tax=Flavobacterium tibetense TaxID=2233533 RepID=A0A365P5N2_9FLAO|nr:LysE family transporter [Flavobacterium tibetense]RBA29928.1 lysine transporter LysE [Flavobacterium tibetense]